MTIGPSAQTVRPLKVAVLSFAHTHAATYVRALAAMPDVALVATDPDGAAAGDPALRGRELAEELGVRYVDDYDEALAWGPDAVIVTSENSRHRALVEAAADAGAHVLCEKPLATAVDDGRAMIAAVERGGVMLTMAFPVRFAPTFTDLRERVRSGALGDILAIRGTNNGKVPRGERGWFTDPGLAGGGALIDHTLHCAQLIAELLGARPESVRAVTNQILYADAGVETGGLVTLGYPGGVVATIDCSWSQPANAPTWGGLTLEVIGSRGIVEIRPFAQHLAGYDASGPIHEPVGDDLDAAMLAEFLDCVRTGRPPVATGEVGLRTLEIVAAAQRSVRKHRPVALDG